MASSEEYLEYVIDLLRDVPEATCKKMLGEYMLYSGGVLFGGVYDDRFLPKNAPAARNEFPCEETHYEGAKPMLLVDSEDPARIAEVVSKRQNRRVFGFYPIGATIVIAGKEEVPR